VTVVGYDAAYWQFIFDIRDMCSEELACIQVGIPGDVTSRWNTYVCCAYIRHLSRSWNVDPLAHSRSEVLRELVLRNCVFRDVTIPKHRDLCVIAYSVAFDCVCSAVAKFTLFWEKFLTFCSRSATFFDSVGPLLSKSLR
jgi:hypothetical protein